jgi:hypothetical protein
VRFRLPDFLTLPNRLIPIGSIANGPFELAQFGFSEAENGLHPNDFGGSRRHSFWLGNEASGF